MPKHPGKGQGIDKGSHKQPSSPPKLGPSKSVGAPQKVGKGSNPGGIEKSQSRVKGR